MTIVPTGSPDGTERLQDALISFTLCVGSTLENLCSYGLTVGEAYVPFLPDPDEDHLCDEDDIMCSQAWVRVMGAAVAVPSEAWNGDPFTHASTIELEVGVLRCIDIPEDGEAFFALDAAAGALRSVADMNAILCAAMNCEVWESIQVGAWNPVGPMGGQYGGIWTFSVEI